VIHSTLPGVARQLAVPQGFTLSTTGVLATLLEHRPHPGAVTIWLFVVGAALGFSVVVRASGAHRSGSTLRPASGYQLFNLSPVAVVPAASLIVWWVPLEPVAYALGGLSASSGYLLAVATLFQAVRRVRFTGLGAQPPPGAPTRPRRG
jgi:CHASE2 domain-containing sensor protein